MEAHNGEADGLPPPPPLSAGDEPLKADEMKKLWKPKRSLAPTNGFGKQGKQIRLVTNHFKVSLKNTEEFFYHYYVSLKYEDDTLVDPLGAGRKVMDKLQQIYATELANKDFAYDGEKGLFTISALPQVNNEFILVMEDFSTGKTPVNHSPSNDSPGSDRKRVRRPYNTKTYKVGLSLAAKIPMSAIALALRGQESEHTQQGIRVMDIMLRQHSAKQDCLLVHQSLFHNNPSNFVDLGGGVMGCRGFHSSFRAMQSGLSLNIDVSTTMIVKPGPVIDFFLANQNVPDPDRIDWSKDKRALKNLRINTSPANSEYKIVGFSEQMITLKHRHGDNGDSEEISVYNSFVKNLGIELHSGGYPCINVGKPKRPTYFPIELCMLLPLQKYTKALSTLQSSSLVEKSRQKPLERMSVLSDVLQSCNYNSERMLMASGISTSKSFIDVDGRVLQAPKLKGVNGEDIFTWNGRWNFNNKVLIRDRNVEKWAVNSFSARCNFSNLVQDLVNCGGMKGTKAGHPFAVFDENPSLRRAPAVQRVEEMFEQVKTKPPGAPKFILCALAGRKDSDVYGPWKKKCLAKVGILTQCVSPTRVSDQYLTNKLQKINAKLGGLNSMLQMEAATVIPFASHGSPGQSNVPSLASVMLANPDPLVLAKAMKAKRSVFTIIVARNRDHYPSACVTVGSGFVIKQKHGRCILLTCEHVIQDGDGFLEDRDRIFVRKMGDTGGIRVEQWRGHLMFVDKWADLAMIRVDGWTDRVPNLKLDLAAEAVVGKSAIAIGYCTPEHYLQERSYTRDPAVSPGVVRSLEKIQGQDTDKLWMDLSCVGMPGMSGGPVICSNSNGVVAVVTSGTPDTTSDGFRITYAVCSETVHVVMRKWLGLPPNIEWSFDELIDRIHVVW